ncbi:MAG: hypothetical protein F6K03_03775 [Kamptonema sp. SIO4C4]|nr:hypothetical protein [Kamptonema sp. SIO4C4]
MSRKKGSDKSEIKKLKESLEENFIKNIADLQAELETLKRFPNESPKDALKTATNTRLFLGSQATQAPLQCQPMRTRRGEQ